MVLTVRWRTLVTVVGSADTPNQTTFRRKEGRGRAKDNSKGTYRHDQHEEEKIDDGRAFTRPPCTEMCHHSDQARLRKATQLRRKQREQDNKCIHLEITHATAHA